jgi:putative transposase
VVKLWQSGSHPIALTTPGQVARCQHYIWQNPVVARLVTEAQHYPFSSACPDHGMPLTPLG